MAKMSDIAPKMNDYYPDAEYISLGELIGTDIEIIDCEIFSNREGKPSAAILFKQTPMGPECRTVTHSQGIIDMLACDPVQDALRVSDHVTARVAQKKSLKTGRNYLTLE